MTKPFLPSDIAHRSPLALWRRSITAQAISIVTRESPGAAIRRIYGEVEAPYIERGAVTPTTTAQMNGLLPTIVAAWLGELRPTSAAARLIEAGTRIEKPGSTMAALPHLGSDFPEPSFVGEGQPIPHRMGAFAASILGPSNKLAMLTSITSEVATYTPADAETLIGGLMNDAASRQLDKAVFSAAAATEIRPAGILNGIAARTAAAGGGVTALVADVRSLVAAINTAGAGGEILVFANPVQVAVLAILAPGGIGYPVLPAASLPIGTLVAIDPRAFASSFGETPEVTASREGLIHYEDTSPAQIGTAGSPNVVAAPSRSMFQSDLIGLRLILRCDWVLRSSAVAFVENVTW